MSFWHSKVEKSRHAESIKNLNVEKLGEDEKESNDCYGFQDAKNKPNVQYHKGRFMLNIEDGNDDMMMNTINNKSIYCKFLDEFNICFE